MGVLDQRSRRDQWAPGQGNNNGRWRLSGYLANRRSKNGYSGSYRSPFGQYRSGRLLGALYCSQEDTSPELPSESWPERGLLRFGSSFGSDRQLRGVGSGQASWEHEP